MAANQDIEKIFAGSIGPIAFRLIWWNSLDRSKRDNYAEDFMDVITISTVKSFLEYSGQSIPEGAEPLIKPLIRDKIEETLGKDYTSCIREFGDNTYESIIKRILEGRNESLFYKLMAEQYDQFTARIVNLSDDLISSVKIINEEFMIWLKTHEKQSSKIHSDAFEQITGEILSSHGFEIQFTGRIKNLSADLIAIEKYENGEEVKYLIECKRYKESNKVGVAILNQVVGASYIEQTSHAMLVTTSSFTSNALRKSAKLEDFRLDLHDGQKVMEWLADYEFKDYGLWLPEGWQDEWKPKK